MNRNGSGLGRGDLSRMAFYKALCIELHDMEGHMQKSNCGRNQVAVDRARNKLLLWGLESKEQPAGGHMEDPLPQLFYIALFYSLRGRFQDSRGHSLVLVRTFRGTHLGSLSRGTRHVSSVCTTSGLQS